VEDLRAADFDWLSDAPRSAAEDAPGDEGFHGYEWEVGVEEASGNLKRVAVTVYWNERGRGRRYRTETLVWRR